MLRYLVFAAWVVGGCTSSDLTLSSAVIRPRLVGAEVSVVGDENRSSPLPGEEVFIEVPIALPDGPEPITWAFAVCPGETRPSVSDCTLAVEVNPQSSQRPATFSYLVPPAAELGGASTLDVYGTVCVGGVPDLARLGENLNGCSSDTESANPLTFTIFLQTEEGANHRPRVESVFLGGTALESDFDGEDFDSYCNRHPEAVVPASTLELPVTVTLDAASYESFVADGETQNESILLSAFATDGYLDRRFSTLDGPDVLSTTLTWNPTSYFVRRPFSLFVIARDGRGGTEIVSRLFCVSDFEAQ